MAITFEMPCGAVWHVWKTPYAGNSVVWKQESNNAEFIAALRSLAQPLLDVARKADLYNRARTQSEGEAGAYYLDMALAALNQRIAEVCK